MKKVIGIVAVVLFLSLVVTVVVLASGGPRAAVSIAVRPFRMLALQWRMS